jgi:hypothetical protein
VHSSSCVSNVGKSAQEEERVFEQVLLAEKRLQRRTEKSTERHAEEAEVSKTTAAQRNAQTRSKKGGLVSSA